ncbi:MAG: glycoside hydrolase family 15 protein, partial [Actinomycetota bacterium]
IETWTKIRDSIKAEVLERGFDASQRAFVQRYDSDDLDASALRLPLVSFLAADDPMMVDTLRAVSEKLGSGGYLDRYEGEDGLEGEEGAFLLCSFWQVDNLLMQGRIDEGRSLLEHLLGCTNDLGLLSEQIDPNSGDLLGNFPQAFSHMGLINSVLNLKQAEEEGICTTCRD